MSEYDLLQRSGELLQAVLFLGTRTAAEQNDSNVVKATRANISIRSSVSSQARILKKLAGWE